jgi:hypothetical protein
VKLLLFPFAIIVFVLLLIVLGAIGMGIAFAVVYVFSRLWRLVMWRSGRSAA